MQSGCLTTTGACSLTLERNVRTCSLSRWLFPKGLLLRFLTCKLAVAVLGAGGLCIVWSAHCLLLDQHQECRGLPHLVLRRKAPFCLGGLCGGQIVMTPAGPVARADLQQYC